MNKLFTKPNFYPDKVTVLGVGESNIFELIVGVMFLFVIISISHFFR